MSDLDRFELFTYLAQADSLAQAAGRLDISKASLSKQIKKLEADLNTDLFSRSGYRLKLTEQGEVLLKQCLRLQRELDDTRSICQQFHEEPEGDLKVVAFGYFANKLVFPRLKQFLQQYPKINLTIDTSEKVPNFEKEQVDLALGFSLPVPNPDEVVQCSMAKTYYITCATSKYFKQHGKPKTLEDLLQHKYISHTGRAKEHIKLKPPYKLNIQPYLLVNSVTSMIECAKHDLGLIQLPIYMLEELLKQKKLVAVLSEFQRVGEHVYYYYPKYRYVQPKVRKFIDFFLKS